MDKQAYLTFAKDIAQQAGDLLLGYFGSIKDIQVKKDNTLVSEADFASDKLIIEAIRKTYPDHAILTEESGKSGESEFTWVIDPLDGTFEFLRGTPIWSVSIGLVHQDHIMLGVVYAPVLNELYWAVSGEGAFLNGKSISVSNVSDLSSSCIVIASTGETEKFSNATRQNAQNLWPPVTKKTRNHGSCAIDLSWIASGRMDAYLHISDQPWDTAAGTIIIQEAGGRVTNYDGSKRDPFIRGTIASNGNIHDEVVKHATQ